MKVNSYALFITTLLVFQLATGMVYLFLMMVLGKVVYGVLIAMIHASIVPMLEEIHSRTPWLR